MKTFFYTLTLASILSLPAWAQDKKAPAAKKEAPKAQENTELKIDTKNSHLTWKGTKLLGVAGSHNGKVSIKEGSITLAADGTPTAGNFVVDMNSIDCLDLKDDAKNKAKLEGHLKSEDFFHVTEHSTATFVLTSATKKEGNTFTITGDLTLRGTKQPVSFDAVIEKQGKGYKATFEPFKVDRTIFKITYAAFGIAKVAQDKAIDAMMQIGGTIMAR
jgi:polyisoprenoid-binding protein YceI